MTTTRSAYLAALTTLGFAAPEEEDASRIQWLRENTVEVRSITPAAEGDDYADLMPLRQLLGDARVVGLGEQTHGDGATFLAKARLIGFLHEVLGFDVLVWETGLADCERVDAALREGLRGPEAWDRGVPALWSKSAQVRPLLEYVEATHQGERPLAVAGLEARFTVSATREALRERLADVVARAGAPKHLAESLAAIDASLATTAGTEGADYRQMDCAGFDDAAGVLVGELEADGGAFGFLDPRERALLARHLQNASAIVRIWRLATKAQSPDADPTDLVRAFGIREETMGDNLVWLADEHFAGRKLIVWAATTHLNFGSEPASIQHPATGAWSEMPPEETMGRAVREALGDDYYAIDFLAHGGAFGLWYQDARPVPPAPAGSLDALLHATGRPYLFLDLRRGRSRPGGAWLDEPLTARPRGYLGIRTEWPAACDAMFFTDRMVPSTRWEESAR